MAQVQRACTPKCRVMARGRGNPRKRNEFLWNRKIAISKQDSFASSGMKSVRLISGKDSKRGPYLKLLYTSRHYIGELKSKAFRKTYCVLYIYVPRPCP